MVKIHELEEIDKHRKELVYCVSVENQEVGEEIENCSLKSSKREYKLNARNFLLTQASVDGSESEDEKIASYDSLADFVAGEYTESSEQNDSENEGIYLKSLVSPVCKFIPKDATREENSIVEKRF